MPIKKKTAKKKTAVTRKFLTKLAADIYDPKTKKFLRLCDGKLQNGPDPTDSKRPMHCGLGELYFAMTGKQPEMTGIDEDGVVNLAVERSPIAGLREAATQAERAKFKQAYAAVKKLGLDDDLTTQLVETIEEAEHDTIDNVDDDDRDDVESHFRDALAEIPNVNDASCGDDSCSFTTYRTRSQRVAAQLREAAKLLP